MFLFLQGRVYLIKLKKCQIFEKFLEKFDDNLLNNLDGVLLRPTGELSPRVLDNSILSKILTVYFHLQRTLYRFFFNS